MTLFRFLCRGIVQRAEMKTVEQCPKHEQNTASTPSGCVIVQAVSDPAGGSVVTALTRHI